MGGDTAPSSVSSSEEESLLEQAYTELSYRSPFHLRKDGLSSKREEGTVDGEIEVACGEYEDMGCQISSTLSDFEVNQRRRSHSVYREVLENYAELRRRSENLEGAKSKILSYQPGSWIEEVGDMKLSEYDVPKTTSLLLVGPKGSGKSSLINRITRVFEDDKFASDRAQVSYNPSVGDGTYFLQEYLIPRRSSSFSLYDTRSLSDDSSENIGMLKHWMTTGVRHGEPVIRDSDSSTLKTQMKYKARQGSYQSYRIRKVNFVIFVINGLSILKSMDSDDEADKRYTEMVATTFNCPFLSFKDDKPVIVVTHGDLLSLSDRARVRVHLGELLGIPPTKIFDIPESRDQVTELAILDMLRYSLEHADRNLPAKKFFSKKGFSNKLSMQVLEEYLPACQIQLVALMVAILIAAIVPLLNIHSYYPHKHGIPPNIHNTHARHPPKHNVPPPNIQNTHVHHPLEQAVHLPRTQRPRTHHHHPPKHNVPRPNSQKTRAGQPPKQRASPPNTLTHRLPKLDIDWSAIRHLWLGVDND
ncbi:hypothetical protein NMG60_11014287 [Bertholletia excelsa]